jgi:hypothetical protein
MNAMKIIVVVVGLLVVVWLLAVAMVLLAEPTTGF